MKCKPNQSITQRTGQPGETEEEVVQDTNHSDHSLHVLYNEEDSMVERNQQEKEGLDNNRQPQEPKRTSDTSENNIRRKRVKWPNNKSKSEWQQFDEDVDAILNTTLAGNIDRKIESMTSFIYNIGMDRFGADEKEVLRDTIRKKLKITRRAERTRKRRKKREKARAQFTSDPFQFTSRLLGKKGSGQLKASKEEVEEYLREMHSDPKREEELPEIEQLYTPGRSRAKRKAASAPGPNGVPYKVYKNCQRITRRLWKLIRVIWRRGRLAESWHKAEGCFIPKEEKSETLKQFRTISLLNVEGKIFLAIFLLKRMTNYMLSNEYIDIAVQKGGVPGVSGCIEHTSVLSQIIREAKDSKGELAVRLAGFSECIWDSTTQRYHVPDGVRELIKEYFNHLQLRFTVGDFTTSWQRLEVGIVTGCTISVILFSAAMNMIVKSVEKKSRGPWMKSGVRQPPGRAFMDDMTISTKTVIEARWTLQELDKMITWARMKVKPSKSRSLVVKNGKVKEERFKIGDESNTNSLREANKLNVEDTYKQLDDWLKAVDKSGLPGKYKAWIYQHGILPRLLWPLLVYDVPMTTVEGMERISNSYLRRWLGVPRSFSSVGLYSLGSKLQLPLKSITEEFKVTKEVVDKEVNEEDAESRLKHSEIVGRVAVGRQGLDVTPTAKWRTATVEEKRQLVQKEVRSMEEESRMVKAVSMKKQRSWLNWEGARQQKLGWNEIWKMEPHRLQFKLKSVYDVLPSPTNLATWGLIDDPKCVLCGKPANLEHILSSCSSALKDGRYTWRHDKVLGTLADTLERNIKKPRKNKEGLTFVNFVKEGEKGQKKKVEGSGLLIAVTNQRPDIVIWSASTKQAILLELTVPWEERIEDANERKRLKYKIYLQNVETMMDGWLFPVEVGSRGFVGQSMWRALRALGIVGGERSKLIGNLCKEAETASMWLWRKRSEQWKQKV
ncbi:Hypothetical predicted protein [Mytilus galloprovincialis]|uniref:Reverse transcriptase domain-containing protein n=1 Tax=Mytilus galloprovincialis TaxID=29158 RepID=A0A8B6FSL2_MYTGA|nr:Hypothetical predicted protein [Mytilus galloprovincialis]